MTAMPLVPFCSICSNALIAWSPLCSIRKEGHSAEKYFKNCYRMQCAQARSQAARALARAQMSHIYSPLSVQRANTAHCLCSVHREDHSAKKIHQIPQQHELYSAACTKNITIDKYTKADTDVTRMQNYFTTKFISKARSQPASVPVLTWCNNNPHKYSRQHTAMHDCNRQVYMSSHGQNWNMYLCHTRYCKSKITIGKRSSADTDVKECTPMHKPEQQHECLNLHASITKERSQAANWRHNLNRNKKRQLTGNETDGCKEERRKRRILQKAKPWTRLKQEVAGEEVYKMRNR